MDPYERVREDDPERCQKVNGQGQCWFRRLEGSDYCKVHTPGIVAAKASKERIRNYKLGQYQQRVGELADNSQVKNLREEIAILRLTLETTLNRCLGENDLLIHSNKIMMLAGQIQRLVESCHKIEQATGFLLDKIALTKIVFQIVEVCEKRINDEGMRALISNDIVALLESNKDDVPVSA